MKTLCLIRHAKSSWDDPRMDDHARVLNTRGRASAKALGAWMSDQALSIDHVICSTAERCVQTWEGIALSMGVDHSPDYFPGLYHASAEEILRHLRKAKGDTVVLLAHNPGIGDLSSKLVYSTYNHPDFARYPTGATTIFDLPINDWAQLDYGKGSIREFVTPRELMSS